MGYFQRLAKRMRAIVAALRHPRNVRNQQMVKPPKKSRVPVEEEVVYHLLLQKVKIIKPNKGAKWLEVDENQLPPEYRIPHTWRTWATKSGTLERLVDNLLTASGDSSHLTILLPTHKGFASAKDVLELLFDRYGILQEQANNNSTVTKPELKSSMLHDGGVAATPTTCCGWPRQLAAAARKKLPTACSSVTSGPAFPPPLLYPPRLRPVYNRQNGEACVIRVSVEGSEGKGYKSLIVTTEDKTKAVIQKAIDAFCIADDADVLELVQLLPEGKEHILPDYSNTYYAMKTAADFNFILRVQQTPLIPGWRPIPKFAF